MKKNRLIALTALLAATCVARQGMTGVTAESCAELAKSFKAARAEASPRNQVWILRAGLDSVHNRM